MSIEDGVGKRRSKGRAAALLRGGPEVQFVSCGVTSMKLAFGRGMMVVFKTRM